MKSLITGNRVSYILSLAAGALIPLNFAPFNVWFLSPLLLALYIALLQHLTPRQAGIRGWLFGLGMFGSGASWIYVSIHEHGYAPVPLAASLTLLFVATIALFYALHAYLYARFLKTKPLGILLGFPASWVLAEWFRSWAFTGFPWLFIGYGHLQSPLAGWYPVIGVYGISFLIALSAALLYLGFRLKGSSRLFIAACLLLPWLIGPALNQINWNDATSNKTINVTTIQGNIPQAIKWQPEQRIPSFDKYRSLTRPHWKNELIVWPETAVPFFYDKNQARFIDLNYEAKKHNSVLLTGIPYQEQEPGFPYRPIYRNSIVALGAGQGLYHKQKLVPFGEYVPLEQWLRGLIQFFNLPMSNFIPGPSDQTLLSGQDYKMAAYICYEIVYPDFVASMSKDADLLVTISNDSWFGESIGPLQHLEMAQTRAAENSRYLVRSTNNGVSAIIDHKGKIRTQTEQFKQQVITDKVELRTGLTPFQRWGSLPILLICTVLIGLTLQFKSRTIQGRNVKSSNTN